MFLNPSIAAQGARRRVKDGKGVDSNIFGQAMFLNPSIAAQGAGKTLIQPIRRGW
jgi:hypothetical protein